jgi:homocysteine S-methyltransferase
VSRPPHPSVADLLGDGSGAPAVLAEGSIYERLRRHPDIPFDASVGTGAVALDARYRDALADVHRGYLRIALGHRLPMLLQTDTWRASGTRVAASAWRGTDLNRANVELLQEIAEEGRAQGGTVVVGGLVGPAGDAYAPARALARAEARAYHAEQAEALAGAGPDLLVAATLPALSETLGLAEALTATGLPVLISFVVRPTGNLLDGTPLEEAVATVQDSVDPAPFGFLLNCVHPRVADAALAASPRVARHMLGLLANTSARSPEELDALEELESADPEPFAREIAGVAARYGLRLLGGCCGTGDEHIAALAGLLAPERAPGRTPSRRRPRSA